MRFVSSGEMRRIDERLMELTKRTSLYLMEQAGIGAADYIYGIIKGMGFEKKVILFAGRGNNGGDAFVCARGLEERNIRTTTFIFAKPGDIKGEVLHHLRKLFVRTTDLRFISDPETLQQALDEVQDVQVGVDGLFGTGLRLPLEYPFDDIVRAINQHGFRTLVSLDVPTGLNADTGEVNGPCIRADFTLSMGLPKKGFVLKNALDWVGKLKIINLKIPESLLSSLSVPERLLSFEEMIPLNRRLQCSHKGDYGRLFIVAGSRGMTGAAILTTKAALEMGTGLVELGSPESLNGIYETQLLEAMTHPFPDKGAGHFLLKHKDAIIASLEHAAACVLGPGLSCHPEVAHLITELIEGLKVPVVLDADALNILEGRLGLLKNSKAPLIITPHPGEMARLTGKTVQDIQSNRIESARTCAQQFGLTVVLKGAGSVIASADGQVFVNVTGNPGMATGGMGDVLSGIIGGLLAQGVDPLEAAKQGVYLHGRCADRIFYPIERKETMLASEIVERISKEFFELETALTSKRWGGNL
ncbi:MAG: NAD(P)H-hydrate dehydratase [Chlamydiota bacterium]|nr:NAD(P)H-hydrate dehydratase [Chlamydiota bacterium]